MVKYSPELIQQTLSLFENRTGRVISEENARQAVENTSGFFQVLQEWAKADDKEECEDTPDGLTPEVGVEQ